MVRDEHHDFEPDPRVPEEGAEHQPVSPAEATRFPPADEGCGRVRGLLRDYVDGDLEPSEVRDVDEHVHQCRDCGLALSRAELEVLRLRKAFEDSAAEAAIVPVGLGAAIRDELEHEVDIAGPSEDFTRVVMDRVNKEWRKPTLADRVPRRRWFATAAVALIGLLIGIFALTPESADSIGWVSDARGAVRVVRAQDAMDASVANGSRLFEGDRIVADAGAYVVVELFDESRPSGAEVSQIELDGRGEFAFVDDGILLVEGSVRVETAWSLALHGLADGAAQLSPGRFDVRVAPRRRFDAALAESRLSSVRLEVLSGQADIARGDSLRAVRGGFVAHFGHWRALEIEAGPTDELVEATSVFTQAVAVDSSGWRGRVIDDRTGLGVPDAVVSLEFEHADLQLETDIDGGFFVPRSENSRFGDMRLCVVSVTPPSSIKLNGIQPRPLALAENADTIDTLRLTAMRPLWGIVQDHARRPLAAARVVPYVVDEVFNLCEAREELATRTDDGGRFELDSMPLELAPQQSVALVIEHGGAPTTAFARVDADRMNGATWTLEQPRDLTLAGLPPTRRVQVLQSVPGLAAAAFAIRTEVLTDADGQAILEGAGSGRVWFLGRGELRGTPLLADLEGAQPVYRVSSSTAEAPGPIFRGPGGGHRFTAMRAQPEQATTFLTVIGQDSIVVPDTRMFLLGPDGTNEYLGVYTGLEAFRFAAPDGPFTIVAIAADGSVGSRHSSTMQRNHESITLQRPVRVDFEKPADGAAQPVAVDLASDSRAMLRFRRLDSSLAGQEFYREVRMGQQPHVSDLLPGDYVVEFGGVDARLLVEVAAEGDVAVGLPIGIDFGAPAGDGRDK